MDANDLYITFMETNDVWYARKSAERLAISHAQGSIDGLIAEARNIAGTGQMGTVYSAMAESYLEMIQKGKIPLSHSIPENSRNYLREIP